MWVESFRHASSLGENDEVNWINTFIYSMEDEADDILSFFQLSETDSKMHDKVMDKFQAYFMKRKMWSSRGPSLIGETGGGQVCW